MRERRGTTASGTKASRRGRRVAGLVLPVAAAGMLAVHWIFPSLTFDTAALILLAIGIVPLLVPYVDRVSVGAATVEMRKQLNEAIEGQGTDQELTVQRLTELSVEVGQLSARLAALDAASATPIASDAAVHADAAEHLERLAAAFADEVGDGQEPAAMLRTNEIFTEMLGHARFAATGDPLLWLSAPQAGRRLVGYAMATVHPSTSALSAVIEALAMREKPASPSQYIATRTLEALVQWNSGELTPHQVHVLRKVARTMPAEAAAQAILQRLLARRESRREG